MSRVGLRIVDCLTSSKYTGRVFLLPSRHLIVYSTQSIPWWRSMAHWSTDHLSFSEPDQRTNEPADHIGRRITVLFISHNCDKRFQRTVPANSPVMWERCISRYSSACSHCGCWTSKANRSADLRPSRVQGNPCTKQRHQAQFQRVSSQICFCQFVKENVICPPFWVLLLSWHQGATNPPTPSAGTAWALSYPWHEPVRGLTRRQHGKKRRHHQHARSLPLFV